MSSHTRPQALVEYSDSDSDAAPPPRKTQKTAHSRTSASPAPHKPASSGAAAGTAASTGTPALPPIPSRFHELYAVPPRVGKDDDPALHGGRKRSIPHVQGNWPTHVFVEWHLSRAEFETLDNVFNAAAATLGAPELGFKLESHLRSDLGSELPLHLSLSRPNVLRTEQREGFLETLEDRMAKARIKPFTVKFTAFEWVANYDRTRWFLVLKASRGPNEELPRILQLTNRTFAAFHQPPLYSQNGDGNDGFHVSLAWSLTKPSAQAEEKVLDALLGNEGPGNAVLGNDAVAGLEMRVDAVRVKIGSTVHMVELMETAGRAGDGGAKQPR